MLDLNITHHITDSREDWRVTINSVVQRHTSVESIYDRLTDYILNPDNTKRNPLIGGVYVSITGKCIPPMMSNVGYLVSDKALKFFDSVEEGHLLMMQYDGEIHEITPTSMSLAQLLGEHAEQMIRSMHLSVAVGESRTNYSWRPDPSLDAEAK